jgi:hypothetical protein
MFEERGTTRRYLVEYLEEISDSEFIFRQEYVSAINEADASYKVLKMFSCRTINIMGVIPLP